ncbi:coagulation factor X-like isoform X2 [Amblyraja radiata]|uniref:coagulation factor X-like isoform X1 n=1 Tax=Amblyraja radiata TaxID=386614 RepID=UPI0014035C46|nr:coagulation factor X-like isoform X1 [Amblyraja radiata]XP_032898867.1 coagulation factor X-like isoform X2 [Amblyraja radiata]
MNMNARVKSREVIILLYLCGQVNCLFVQKPVANSFLSRARRANAGLEELLGNDLQRECFEETCSKEEAREFFKDDQKTEDFWKRYKGSPMLENVPEEHGDHTKLALNSTLSTNTTEGGGGPTVSPPLEQAFSWSECDVKSILTLGRQILEMQEQVIECRRKLIDHKERLVNKVQNLLHHSAWSH